MSEQIYRSSQKFIYLLVADLMFAIHFAVILINLFGWVIPGLFLIFMVSIISTIIVDIFVGYCPITKLEFDLRRRLNPEQKFAPTFIGHYLYQFFKIGQPPVFERLTVRQKKKFNGFTLTLFILLALGLFFKFVVYN